MRIQKAIIICALLFSFVLLSAQEYSFDFEDFEKKPYELIGNFKFQSDFTKLDKSPALYSLNFLKKAEVDYWDSYSASLKLIGSYELSMFKFSLDIKDQLTYTTNNKIENNFNIYESFVNTDISKNIDLQIGKKSVKWGKGYIWNPVSFVGRQKDINDVDAGLEGFWLMKLDYVKSLSGVIQNFSITPAIVPVLENINEDFQDEENFNFILNSYFLIKDTDLDFYLLMKDDQFQKFGLDLARNIIPSWEIHTEYVFSKNVVTNWWNSDFVVKSTTDDTHDYLFGTRILFETNTTLIIEYLHNDAGLNTEQMVSFFDAVEFAISDNPDLLPGIKQYQSESFISQFLMKDYLYAKVSQPEPFDILYFTPSVYILYNLNDNSEMIGGELSYSRFENLNLKLKYNLLFGELNSEFGGKISSDKLSLLIDYTF